MKDKLKTVSSFYAVNIADLNKDGLNDIIGATTYQWDASSEDAQVFIYWQSESGKFTRNLTLNYPKYYPGLKSMAIADVNNNGLPDIVIAIADYIGISYQTSANTFSNFETFLCAHNVDQVLCLDLNHDSLPDILAKNYEYNSFAKVFYQTNTGFREDTIPNDRSYAYALLATADFNNDSLRDVVHYYSFGQPDTGIYILYNESPKGFRGSSKGLTFPAGESDKSLQDLTTGDINTDGYLDVIGLNIFSRAIYAWTNLGDDFKLAPKILTDEYARRIEIADLNCDDQNEIVVFSDNSLIVQEASDNFSALHTFYVPEQYSSPTMWYNQNSIADLNNDGKKDAAIAFLDGIVIMENHSETTDFMAVDTVPRVDTLIEQQGTFQYKILKRSNFDTIPMMIVQKADSVLITVDYINGVITTDTVFYRYRETCHTPFRDTVYSPMVTNDYSLASRDSLIYFTSYDTIAYQSSFPEIFESGMAVFPNPAHDQITLVLPHPLPFSRCFITIYSIEGQLVYSDDFTMNDEGIVRLYLTQLKQGVYTIRLKIDNHITYRKLIIY